MAPDMLLDKSIIFFCRFFLFFFLWHKLLTQLSLLFLFFLQLVSHRAHKFYRTRWRFWWCGLRYLPLFLVIYIIGITLPNLVPRLVDRLRVDSIVGGSVFPCPVFWIVVPFWMTELIHLIPRTTMVLYWRWCPSVVLLRLFACHVVLFWKLPCWFFHSFVYPRSFRCHLAVWAFCYHVIVFSLVSVHELALLLFFENGISGCLWIFYI